MPIFIVVVELGQLPHAPDDANHTNYYMIWVEVWQGIRLEEAIN